MMINGLRNAGHYEVRGELSIPAVSHLHGGELPPQLDGGPDAWFISSSSPSPAAPQGYADCTRPGVSAGTNEAVYRYLDSQEVAPIWFHDHTLGATRLNVNAGLAGPYLIGDDIIRPGVPGNLPLPGSRA